MPRRNTSSKCRNMHSTLVYVLYGTVLCSVYVGSLGVAGSDATLPVLGHPSGSNVNATVAKVIDAMLADGPKHDGAIPIPEHHHDKAQRIVPRKGVDNDGSSSSAASARLVKNGNTSLNVGSSTSQSAPVIASDDKPNVVSTVAPALTAGKSTEARNATSGGVATKGSPVGSAPSQLSLANATTIVNKTTVVSTSSISSSSSSSSSTSAISAVSSTHAPPQSKPPVVGGSTSTARVSTANSTSSTTTSSTITSSTTTTTTTTTKPPKKPKVTYSVEDEPKLLQAAKPGYASPYDTVDSNGRLRVDEPLAQLSKEYIPQTQLGGRDAPNSRREYVVPIVTLIFAIPLLLGLFLLSYRRAKEFWLTRHYRRMDFLIDGMYNY